MTWRSPAIAVVVLLLLLPLVYLVSGDTAVRALFGSLVGTGAGLGALVADGWLADRRYRRRSSR